MVVSHGLTRVSARVVRGSDELSFSVDVGPGVVARLAGSSNDVASSLVETLQPIVSGGGGGGAGAEVSVLIHQADGGVLSAAINAASLALTDAGVPLRDLTTSLCAGVHIATPLLDLTADEESNLPHLTLALLPHDNTVVLASMQNRLHFERFQPLLDTAAQACKVVHAELQDALRTRTARLTHAMADQ